MPSTSPRPGHALRSPYNDPDVIAGQATVARELASQVPDLGTVVVPCGGGGLLSGVILALAETGVRIVGVESEASPSMSAAVAAGAIVPIHVEPTVADGLAGNLEPGAVTVGIVASHHVEVLTVSEADIRSAMAFSAPRWASSSRVRERSGWPRCGPGWWRPTPGASGPWCC